MSYRSDTETETLHHDAKKQYQTVATNVNALSTEANSALQCQLRNK